MLKIVPIKFGEIHDVISNVKAYKQSAINYKDIFKGKLFKYIIKRNVYKVVTESFVEAYIVKNIKNKALYVIVTEDSNESISSIVDFIGDHSDFSGYEIPIIYRSLEERPSFNNSHIKVLNDIKYMYVKPYNSYIEDSTLEINQFKINHDEEIRVFLQNKIFENGKKERRELTIEEVTEEEFNLGFNEKLCFILHSLKVPCGYVQIIILNKLYYLVNFGIIPDYRNKGLGKKLLLYIINKADEFNIKNLYLTVDNSNSRALKLYYDTKFKELYNIITIGIEQH